MDEEKPPRNPRNITLSPWWRLRTQTIFVLGVLLFLIVFLGFYALNAAHRNTLEADELLRNFKVSSLLKQVERARADELRAAAKFRVTHDPAYAKLAASNSELVGGQLQQLRAILSDDENLVPLVDGLGALTAQEPGPRFADALRELDRRLEAVRETRAERLRSFARDLDKIISLVFFVAVAVAGWLGVLHYFALLKPLESIRRAAGRIREGELSSRVERFRGFAELSELRREFNAMAGKIEELDRMKSDFLSTVSHELRTPLTALKEGLHLLSERQAMLPAQAQARTLEVCNQSAKRLETMIQNLLNHAKMDSGFYSFDERPKDFVAVVEAAAQGVRTIAERRGAAIEVRVKMAQHMASFSVEGITHVLENLLLNAVKYGDATHPIVVEVSRLNLDPVCFIEVRVTNHGKSLLPSELSRVFERFFRASNADGQKGVGLGLSVVKRIIEAHHGTVTATSAAGVTTFLFRIPQRYESLAAARPVPELSTEVRG